MMPGPMSGHYRSQFEIGRLRLARDLLAERSLRCSKTRDQSRVDGEADIEIWQSVGVGIVYRLKPGIGPIAEGDSVY